MKYYKIKKTILIISFLFYFAGCTTQKKSVTQAKKTTNYALSKEEQKKFSKKFYETGIASYYSPSFKGKKTANGEIYNPKLFTAASKNIQINTMVKVESVKTKKYVIVRINDRGPHKKNRVIDLSEAAAKQIGLDKKGRDKVNIYIDQ